MPVKRGFSVPELAAAVLAGDIRAIGRAISIIENDREGSEKLADILQPRCGKAAVWGITGPPGGGKSTLVDALLTTQALAEKKIAVIAVDPSSPFSGGALLGDRVRMANHADNPNRFIRSMASRGSLGGVAAATGRVIKLFDAAGYSPIIVETIGVGQNEVDIMRLVDITMLLLVPNLGDEIQALKAGVMEIGDIFVINKSDLPGVDRLKREIEYSLSFKKDVAPVNPIVLTSARDSIGIEELVAKLFDYQNQLITGGILADRRRRRLTDELKSLLESRALRWLHTKIESAGNMEGWTQQLQSGRISLNQLVGQITERAFK